MNRAEASVAKVNEQRTLMKDKSNLINGGGLLFYQCLAIQNVNQTLSEVLQPGQIGIEVSTLCHGTARRTG